MKKLSSLFIALILMLGVVIGLSPIIVSATSESELTNPVISVANPPEKDINGLKTMCSNANARIHDKNVWNAKDAVKAPGVNIEAVQPKNFLEYDYDTTAKLVNITVNMTEYKKLKEKEKQIVMQEALNTVIDKTTTVSRTNKNKVYNTLCSLDVTTSSLVRQLSDDVTADFYGAYGYFRPWSGKLGVFLGVIALAMFILLGITITIDLAYIVLPFVQLLFNDLGYKKNRPKFVSIEAVNAVKEAESKAGQGYTNPVSVYFHSKTKQLIAIALCLVYLVSGEIYNLIGSIMDYFHMAVSL